ncbi:MAG TPA: type II secretion system F family protein [Oligoflexia bacterium]|nr:type II secretion system F family protein [Oligoflexia bacterium]HMP26984.1 type II secretion system F family protein [Oligoflexia bacterium]
MIQAILPTFAIFVFFLTLAGALKLFWSNKRSAKNVLDSLAANLEVASFKEKLIVSPDHTFSEKKLSNLSRKQMEEITIYLPIIMERLVVAIQAGLDILPAIKKVIEFSKYDGKGARSTDLVTQLLERVLFLTEQGVSFEDSLKAVSAKVNHSGIKHAFLHLAIAYRDGGELLGPLRELSDSTQQMFQESVEEEIAKFPVKAIMPLISLFVGLLICFMVVPMLQIAEIAGKATISAVGAGDL